MIQKLAKIVLFTIPTSFLLINIIKDWPTILQNLSNVNAFFVIQAFVILLLVYPEGAYCWYLVLRKMKLEVSLNKSLGVWIISNTSRYIPGSIWQYLSRVVLSEKIIKISKTQATASTIIEAFFILSGSIIASLLVLNNKRLTNYNLLYFLAFLLLVVSVFYSRLSKLVLQLLNKITKKDINIDNFVFSLTDSLKLIPFFILNFIINGLALYLIIHSFNISLPLSDVIILSGYYSLSWFLGYISFFAPGGLGVTEVSLAFFLSSLIPTELTFIIAIFYRLLLTLSELLVFLFFLKTLNIKNFLKK